MIMFNFILSNFKSIGITIWGFFTLYILNRNSKLSQSNNILNSDLKDQSETIKTKNKVINVLRNTKDTDINGNIKRMLDKEL